MMQNQWLNPTNRSTSHCQTYLLLSPAGDSAPSMHLSSWLATICRSSSSSRVSRSNWSSCGERHSRQRLQPHIHHDTAILSLLFKTHLMPVRIKCKTHFCVLVCMTWLISHRLWASLKRLKRRFKPVKVDLRFKKNTKNCVRDLSMAVSSDNIITHNFSV